MKALRQITSESYEICSQLSWSKRIFVCVRQNFASFLEIRDLEWQTNFMGIKKVLLFTPEPDNLQENV